EGGAGGDGGGFFQFGGGGFGGGATGGGAGIQGGGGFYKPDPFASFDAVLIVHHQVQVHERIELFLNQLLFGDPQGNLQYGGVPTEVLPEGRE
ncbi:MAG: hypothetical protein KDA75_13825, partial [Planctomycetaceae bacterium]|nr:hypothetical protein [Planctomycetaceae bacterium]